MQNYKRKSKY